MQPSVNIPNDIIPLFESALLAPTSFNFQHWQFVLIEDKGVIDRLLNGVKISDNNLFPQYLVVICGDRNTWKEADNYSMHLDPEHRKMVKMKSSMVYSENPVVQRDEVFRTCGFGVTNFLWKAKQQGLGYKILDNIDSKLIKGEINLPENYLLVDVIALDENIPANAWPETNSVGEILINDGW